MISGFHKYQSQGILRDYFKDRDTYNFKHGLEYGIQSNVTSNPSDNSLFNLDEDPTILGFDLVILNNSPLFNDIDGFIDFADANSIIDVSNRRETYSDFISQFSKFFNVDDRNRGIFKSNDDFNSFKTHYLHGVKGLDNLIHYTGSGFEKSGKQMTKYGEDKITIKLTEDTGINAGYLSALYRTLIYSKKNGRMVIPENLIRFDMTIIISEVRNFNRVSNTLVQDNPNSIIPVLNDNVSRYIFNLYECQFDFNKFSFENDIDQGGFGGNMDISNGLEFDIYFKYVSTEVEKFDFRPDYNDEIAKYLNDSKDDPNTFQVNSSSDSSINNETNANGVDKHPNRPLDNRFHMNTNINSDLNRSYEFDFPMMKSEYVKSNTELRNKNLNIEQDQSTLRTGVNNIIDRSNQQLQTKFIETRSQLISGIAGKIRGITGLRNIQAPVNVYESSSIGQFFLNKVKDFANLGVGEALSLGTGYVNKLAQGGQNSVFDIANRGVDSLKGLDSTRPNSTQDILGDTEIPNVYKK